MSENTWPNPDRPGVPLNPEKDGWHWLEDTVDGVETGHIEAVYYAVWDVPIWYRAGNKSPITKPKQWRYLGPCLTPAEAVALQAENAKLREALDKAADALHDAGCYDAWAAARATLGKKSMGDYHEGLEESIKIGMAESTTKIEKLREAIEVARQCIDANDVIGAHQILTNALGEKE